MNFAPLGAPSGLLAPSSGMARLQHPAGTAPGAGSASRHPRLRVSAQAFNATPKGPGRSQRVREASPSKPRAAAAAAEAPVWEAAQQHTAAPPAPPSLAQGGNAIVSFERQQLLERLFQGPAAHGSVDELEQQARQQAEEQRAAEEAAEQQEQATAARLAERRQQAAAASTSERDAAAAAGAKPLVRGTRRARGESGAGGAVRAGSAARGSAGATSSLALTSWLLDVAERRAGRRGVPAQSTAAAAAPAAGAPAQPAAAAAAQGRTGKRHALQLSSALGEGLSRETLEDRELLMHTRDGLRAARRSVRRRPNTTQHTSANMEGAVAGYLAALGNTPVLGREQEARLAEIMQKGREVEAVAARLAAAAGDAPPPTPAAAALRPHSAEARREAAAAAAAAAARVSDAEVAAACGLPAAEVAARRANQREAKDLLMQYNVRMVVNLAKRYAGSGVSVADLVPEGMQGLSKALDRFEPARGFKISTFSHWWIRQQMSRAITDQSRVVRLPGHVCEALYRISKAAQALEGEELEGEEQPPYERLAAEVGLPVPRVVQYLRLARMVGAGGGPDAGSATGVNGQPLAPVDDLEAHDGGDDLTPEEAAAEAERQADCMRCVVDLLLSTLGKRERNVLRLRYGLLPGPVALPPGAGAAATAEASAAGAGADLEPAGSMSLGEVAVAYGLSRERIRQIEDKAMRALRKPWRLELVKQLNFGEPVAPASLTHLASVQQAANDSLWA